MWFKVRNKFFATCIEVTPFLRKTINRCKNTHLRLATTFNQLKFLQRCKRYNIEPTSFKLTIPFYSKYQSSLRKQVAVLLLRQRIKDLHAIIHTTQLQELSLRQTLENQLNTSSFQLLWLWLLHTEQELFIKKRKTLMQKFTTLAIKQGIFLHNNVPTTRSTSITDPPTTTVQQTGNIVNISSYTLSSKELQLLSKGLSYVPVPPLTPSLNFKANIESAAYMIADTDNEQLAEQFINTITANLQKAKRANRYNLDRSPISSLLRNSDIFVLSADKGKNVTIMNRSDYYQNIQTALSTPSYVIATESPASFHLNRLTNFSKKLVQKHLVEHSFHTNLMNAPNSTPHLYGNPKIHKLGYPMRLIVSTCGTPFSILAKWLVPIMTPLTRLFNFNPIIKNSDAASHLIRNHPSFQQKLISLDVTNLFGSIPVDAVLEILTDLLYADHTLSHRTNLHPSLIVEATTICLNATFFKFNDVYYTQINGLAMGSPLSPILADLYLLKLEVKINRLEGYLFIDFYIRYVDDNLITWLGTDHEFNEFLTELNSLDNYIKYTVEKEVDNQIPFLDLLITHRNNKFSTSMYAKPHASNHILNYYSNHPPHVKSGIIKGIKQKIINCSSTPTIDLRSCKNKFMANNYPIAYINSVMNSTETPPNSTINGNQKPPTLISIPYIKGITSSITKKIKSTQFKFVYKSNTNLEAIFASKYKQKSPPKAGGVYEVSCQDCPAIYIGETKRDLPTRIAEHKRDHQKALLSKPISNHILTSSHSINWHDSKFIAFEPFLLQRKFKEAFFIDEYLHEGIPLLNLNRGWIIKGKW